MRDLAKLKEKVDRRFSDLKYKLFCLKQTLNDIKQDLQDVYLDIKGWIEEGWLQSNAGRAGRGWICAVI